MPSNFPKNTPELKHSQSHRIISQKIQFLLSSYFPSNNLLYNPINPYKHFYAHHYPYRQIPDHIQKNKHKKQIQELTVNILFYMHIYNLNHKEMIFSLRNHLLFVVVLLLVGSVHGFEFDVKHTNKYGNNTIWNTTCNFQTQIDFYFDDSAKLSCNGICTITNVSSSYMKFLNVNGKDYALNLTGASYTNSKLDSIQDGGSNTRYFVFEFKTSNTTSDQTYKVYVIAPVTSGITTTNPKVVNLPKLNQTQQYPFTGLLNVTKLSNGMHLSVFNFLNLMDYSRFYHVAQTDNKTTVLLSVVTVQTASQIQDWTTTSPLADFVGNYNASGDKLCYGSNQVSQIFQTHLRESWPMWTAWFAVLFFWLYYLIAPSNTMECFDKNFENNKKTCWPFYSVHFIGHEEFFTRLSRISLMLINFSIQGVIIAAMYSTIGPVNDQVMILWAGVIAAACTHFVPYFFGCVFLSRIYDATLEKFKIMKKSKSTAVKQQTQEEIYEQQIDKLQERLFTLYYWFYILAFSLFIGLWTVSTHLLTLLAREHYHLQHDWIASLAVAFGLENLVLEPLLMFIFGNFGFYRKRGFFYNFQLGEEYKEIEE